MGANAPPRRISSVGKSLGMKLAHKGLGVGKVSAEAQTSIILYLNCSGDILRLLVVSHLFGSQFRHDSLAVEPP